MGLRPSFVTGADRLWWLESEYPLTCQSRFVVGRFASRRGGMGFAVRLRRMRGFLTTNRVTRLWIRETSLLHYLVSPLPHERIAMVW